MRRTTLVEHSAVCFSLAVLIACSSTAPTVEDETARATYVLANTFETVGYVDATFLVRDLWPGGTEGVGPDLRAPYTFFRSALNSLQDGAAANVLNRATSLLVGAAGFESPTGLGAIVSSKCYVAVMQHGVEPRNALPARDVQIWRSMSMWTWSAPLSEFGEGRPQASQLTAISVADRALVVCNNRTNAERVASSLTDEASVKSPADLTSLRKHRYWLFRRYRWNDVTDPMAAATDHIPRHLATLSFHTDSVTADATLRATTSERTTSDVLELQDLRAGPALKRVNDVAWEGGVDLRDANAQERMFIIIGLFGFAIYL